MEEFRNSVQNKYPETLGQSNLIQVAIFLFQILHHFFSIAYWSSKSGELRKESRESGLIQTVNWSKFNEPGLYDPVSWKIS